MESVNSYEILVFGICKELLGKDRIVLESKDPLTSEKFETLLIEKFHELKKVPSLRISADYKFIEKNAILSFNSEIALIPPVSGG